MYQLIADLSVNIEQQSGAKVHKVIVSSAHNFKEMYAQVGLSVFLGREHMNSIYNDTTYFGIHQAGFFGCLRDHLYILEKQGLPYEIFEFHLLSKPKDSNLADFIEFIVSLILHRISEEYTNTIRILADKQFLENMAQESDWEDVVDSRSTPIDPISIYAQYLNSGDSDNQ